MSETEAKPDKLDAETSIDALRGAAETLNLMRDACLADRDRRTGSALDFVTREIERHIDVIDDFVFPGRRHLGKEEI